MFCDSCLIEVEADAVLNHIIIEHLDKMERRIMTAFSDVQTAIDGLAAQAGDIATQIGTVQSELAPALSGTVDLSALQTNLGNAQSALTALASLVPAPAPEPTPAP